MASMRDIKRRRESITSTSQITKAMKLVSTVKLQKAKGRAEESKPYFEKMYDTVSSMLAKSGNVQNAFLGTGKTDGPKKTGIIVITSNRGLAGGYNSNIVKMVVNAGFDPENTVIYPVGRKGLEALRRLGYHLSGDFNEVMNKPLFGDAVSIGKTVTGDLESGKIDEIYLAYTVFKNTMTQIPTLLKILPFTEEDLDNNSGMGDLSSEEKPEKKDDAPKAAEAIMNYEPEEEETLSYIIPMYMNSLIFGALVEASASENGARMQAMDNATSNAEEMIDTLGLQYNRARQAAITQELTEIVAGAAAIE
ncbi:MAG: ATP synthase F1 subunit gamma [Eubacterium sp.]|nr:ATP synthase F1 subunit gamma [Eubacterium sp.]MBQ7200334.1 ATP synthase F1 subunit gamma [Eubacterium sp.]